MLQAEDSNFARMNKAWRFNVEDYWPCRLLHIPTMTSIQRHTDDEYTSPNGKVYQRPRYSILTYTWGRFRQGSGPALPVNGTQWGIPPIDPEKFTVSAFQRVVNDHLASDGIEWAWIDVACINQAANSRENAEEVGHQAAIFDKADAVFVWLWSLDTATVTNVFKDICNQGPQLEEDIERFPGDFDTPLYNTMISLRKALNKLLQDPWFSSLWTLQELVLRKDAKILSSEVETVVWEEKWTANMITLVNVCQNIWQIMETIEQRQVKSLHYDDDGSSLRSKLDIEVTDIKKSLLSAGFYYLFSDNPNVQYGTARFRTTLHHEDRIYAIMQIYNLRVGKSARPELPPELHPSLTELELEFGAAISKSCPIVGQLFTHTMKELPKRSWCITMESTVPDELRAYRNPEPQCQMALTEAGTLKAQGKCCRLKDLSDYLRHLSVNYPAVKYGDIYLDQYVHTALNEAGFDTRKSCLNNASLIPMLLMRYRIPNLMVLQLGRISLADASLRIGLILGNSHPAETRQNVRPVYYRYGVYTWVKPTKAEVDWQERELLIE